MSGRAVFAVLIALAVSGVPLAAFCCGEAHAAAMDCCPQERDDGQRLGRADDCCHDAAAGTHGPAVAARLERPQERACAPSLAVDGVSPFALPSPTNPARGSRRDRTLTADPSPPRSPVLRL